MAELLIPVHSNVRTKNIKKKKKSNKTQVCDLGNYETQSHFEVLSESV